MHSRNSVRYYLLIATLLIFFFFSNDFGIIDIQKTALVLAVGVDREDNQFIVTTQIAVPQSSAQGKDAQAVQMESRGETVADALNQINIKTGWYPKLVFCNLVVLGEGTVRQNVFDALDFFLRDEYMSDRCLVAACEGTAKEILDTVTPIDPISSVAAGKVLSDHARKVGTVAPATLREFAMGYFSSARSGWLPILKPETLEESSGQETGQTDQDGQSGGSEDSEGGQGVLSAKPDALPAAAGGPEESGGKSGGQGGGQSAGEKVFSAAETMLFSDGKAVETLTPEETFAFSIVVNKLRLAAYTTESDGVPYTLNIKRNRSRIKFRVDDNAAATLDIDVKAVAGIESAAFSQTVPELSDTKPVPRKVLDDAETSLKEQILAVFEKSRDSACDLFGVTEKLRKFESAYYSAYREDILDRLQLNVTVSFDDLR